MTDITTYLNDILTEESGEDVVSAIVSVLTALKTDRYTTADIDTYVGIIQNGVYGKSVKGAIYDSLVALSSVEPTGAPFEPESEELILIIEEGIIDNKEYGRDIRQAIHDALLKLACYEKNIDYDETKVAVVELGSNNRPIAETVQYFDTVRNASSYISGESANFFVRVGMSCADTSGFSSQRFSYASNLKIVEIHNNTAIIDDSCFEDSGLEQIELPDTITDIRMNAFTRCDLIELTLPGTATLGVRICGECDKLERVVMSQGITSIPQQAFQDCTNLTDVVIPDGVLTIGMLAFQGCGMSSINIPSTVTTINSMAFTGCTNLTQITVQKAQDSISGSPWGATNATVTWTG